MLVGEIFVPLAIEGGLRVGDVARPVGVGHHALASDAPSVAGLGRAGPRLDRWKRCEVWLGGRAPLPLGALLAAACPATFDLVQERYRSRSVVKALTGTGDWVIRCSAGHGLLLSLPSGPSSRLRCASAFASQS